MTGGKELLSPRARPICSTAVLVAVSRSKKLPAAGGIELKLSLSYKEIKRHQQLKVHQGAADGKEFSKVQQSW